MIALGADGIQMGPTAYLTAVDTSLNHALSPVDRDNDRVSVSLNELQRVIRLWREQQGDVPENAYKALFQYVHPLVIGAVDRAERCRSCCAVSCWRITSLMRRRPTRSRPR